MLVQTRVGHGGRRGAGVGQWQGGRGAGLHWVLVGVKMAAQGSNLVAQYPKIEKYFTHFEGTNYFKCPSENISVSASGKIFED